MKIKKAQLETLIRMSQSYWSGDYWTGNGFDHEKAAAVCKGNAIYSNKTFGDMCGYVIRQLVDGIVSGKQKEISVEDIIKIFEMLGYEVTE